jgi:hypothetical protein
LVPPFHLPTRERYIKTRDVSNFTEFLRAVAVLYYVFDIHENCLTGHRIYAIVATKIATKMMTVRDRHAEHADNVI